MQNRYRWNGLHFVDCCLFHSAENGHLQPFERQQWVDSTAPGARLTLSANDLEQSLARCGQMRLRRRGNTEQQAGSACGRIREPGRQRRRRHAAEHMAKLSVDEIILARTGHALNKKRDAALQFARNVIETRGKVSDADLQAVREAGYTEANVAARGPARWPSVHPTQGVQR